MTTTIDLGEGKTAYVTTELDPNTGSYTTTVNIPAFGVSYQGTPQSVMNQLSNLNNQLVENNEIEPSGDVNINLSTVVPQAITSQQFNIGKLVNAPNTDAATPVPAPDIPTTTGNYSTSTTTTTTTTAHTGGGSVITSVNPDGTITKTVVPGQNSTVTTTTTESANPDSSPQPLPAVNTPAQQVAPGLQTTQENTPQITGSADEDRNAQNAAASNQQSGVVVNNSGNNPSTSPASATSASSPGATTQSTSSSGAVGGLNAPGARVENPLSSLASYNYIISLYTMSPAAHDAWVQSGKKDPAALGGAQMGQVANGVYLICQSGGINNTTTQRAPGFELDYYIDNLKCTSLINAKASGGDYFNIEFSFTITEPYGFSFITNLRKAQSILYNSPQTTASGSSSTNAAGPPANPLKGMYILGIKFLGWNLDGSQATGQEQFTGGTLDENGTQNGLFQQYYDIQITGCTFKLDGRPVVYNITAVPLNTGAGLGTKRATIDTPISIEGGTVDSAFNGPTGIITQMNNNEANLVKTGKAQYANTYELTYLGPDVDLIKNATIVSAADVDKYKWANADVKKPSDSNDATAQKSPPNNTTRTVSIGAGTNISAAIGSIIKQSSYLTSALNAVYTTSLEPTSQGSPEAQTNDKPKKIAWYNLSVETTQAKWDITRGDWVYHISYVITTYDTPSIQTPYASDAGEYLGPYKRYDYWFTGQNKEVMGLSFNYDTSYFLGTQDASTTPNNSASQNNNAPYAPNKPAGGSNQARLGLGMIAQNSYTTYLYDPQAYQSVQMKIMGDPDYLVTLSPPPPNAAEVYNKFYGPGKTINPKSSQCFIEVNFLEATDYDNNTGVLNLNDQIFFGLGSPSSGVTPKGIIFMVIQVDNDFVGGKFTQTITMNGTPWPNISNQPNPNIPRPGTAPSNSGNTSSSGTSTGSGPTPGNNNATAQYTGLRGSAYTPDEAANAAAWAAATKAEYLASLKAGSGNGSTTPTPKTTPTGPQGQQVADGDANPNPGGTTTASGQPAVPQYINSRA